MEFNHKQTSATAPRPIIHYNTGVEQDIKNWEGAKTVECSNVSTIQSPYHCLSLVTCSFQCIIRCVQEPHFLSKFKSTFILCNVFTAVLRLHVVRLSVRLSVTLVDQDHIGWKSWKLIARSIRPTPLLFVAQRPST